MPPKTPTSILTFSRVSLIKWCIFSRLSRFMKKFGTKTALPWEFQKFLVIKNTLNQCASRFFMVLKQFQSITPVLVVKKVHFYKTHHMMQKTREGGVTREKVKLRILIQSWIYLRLEMDPTLSVWLILFLVIHWCAFMLSPDSSWIIQPSDLTFSLSTCTILMRLCENMPRRLSNPLPCLSHFNIILLNGIVQMSLRWVSIRARNKVKNKWLQQKGRVCLTTTCLIYNESNL